MQDRQSTYPGRVMLTPVAGSDNTYDMTLADIPLKPGTKLDKASLLQNSTAALCGLGEDATPNDAIAALAMTLSALQSSLSSTGGSVANLGTTITNLKVAVTELQNQVNAINQKLNGMIKYGTSDMTPGVTNLETGTLYVVYK